MKRLIVGITGGVIGALVTVGGLWSLQHFEWGPFENTDVYPTTLNDKHSSELGELVLDIMTPEKEGWWWNWKSNSNIIWQDGISSSGIESSREGMVRVNVLGNFLKVLKEREVEIGWSIALRSTDMPAKFGPDTIDLSPATRFGTGYDECDFDPLPSLDKMHISHSLVCQFNNIGGGKEVYLLQHPSKGSVLMTLERNVGSGGENDFLSFKQGGVDEAHDVCNPDLTERLSYEGPALTASEASPSGEYDAVAAKAIASVAAEKNDIGKSCSFTVALSHGSIFYSSIEPGGYAPLCDKAMRVVINTDFPQSKVPGTTIMRLSILR